MCVPPRSSQLVGGEREEDVLEDVVKLPMVQPAHQVQLHLRKLYHLLDGICAKQLGLVGLQERPNESKVLHKGTMYLSF